MSGIMSAMIQAPAAAPPSGDLYSIYGADLLDDWIAGLGKTVSGGNYTAWASQYGNTTSLAGSGTITDETVGGKPSVYTAQYGVFSATVSGYPSGSGGETRIFKIQPDATSSYVSFYLFSSIGSGFLSPNYAYLGGGANDKDSTAAPAGAYDTVIMSITSGASPTLIIRINGTQVYSGTIGTRSMSGTTAQIGANAFATNFYHFREVAIVNRSSTTAEMQAVETYMTATW